MPLIYWFSRRMTLWGSISFNLAVFINIIIAFFYPYVESTSTGQHRGPGGGDLGAHGPLSQVWTEPWGQLGSEGTDVEWGEAVTVLPSGLHIASWETQVWSSGTDRLLHL